MTCWRHSWEGHSISTLDLWARCVNCGDWQWDPYRVGLRVVVRGAAEVTG